MTNQQIWIGDWLRSQRALRRMRQEQVARELKVSERVYRKWENGIASDAPTELVHLRAISDWTGTPVAELERMIPR